MCCVLCVVWFLFCDVCLDMLTWFWHSDVFRPDLLEIELLGSASSFFWVWLMWLPLWFMYGVWWHIYGISICFSFSRFQAHIQVSSIMTTYSAKAVTVSALGNHPRREIAPHPHPYDLAFGILLESAGCYLGQSGAGFERHQPRH